MDKAGLGRALGYGARHAAKALTQALEAATAPDPSAPVPAPPQTAAAAPPRTQPMQRAVRATGRSFFAPLASFSKTLWLEVTGTFFALVALFMGGAAWKLRGAIRLTSSSEAHRLYLCTGIFVVFTYFAVSSFVRARRS